MGRRFRHEDLKLTRQILGEQVEFSVNSDGEFSTHAGGEWITGDTFKEVFAKARKALQRIRRKVAIPATLFGLREVVRSQMMATKFKARPYVQVTITGVNPKSLEVQAIEDATGEPVKVDRWDRRDVTFCKRMTDAEARKYTELLEAQKKADEEFSAYRRKWEIAYPAELVKKELARTADDPNEEDIEDTGDPR